MTAAADNLLQEEVIKRRLLVDGDGVGDDRRILSLMKSYVQFCTTAKEMSAEQRETGHRRLIGQLHQISMSISRTQEMIRVNAETHEMFAELGTSLRIEVEETKGHIVTSKKLLEDATKHRKHAMEYDALARLIHSQPDRKETQQKKTTLTQDLNSLKIRESSLNNKLYDRKQNLSILAGSIERLKDLLKNEEEELPTPPPQETPMEVDTPTPPIPSTSSKKNNESTPMEETSSAPKHKFHEDLSEDETA